jgi:hypothetical protein
MTFKRVNLSGADPVGDLYTNGQRYLRGIHPEARGGIDKMFQSGLIHALMQRMLIPMTEVLTDNIPDELEGYDLVLEHEAIVPVTYPREWSFRMVRSAALAFLEINEVALGFGYMCKDAHLFNFVFCGMSPKWVDIGSFVPYEPGTRALPWVKDYYSGILMPLQMWSDGAGLIASRAVSSPTRHFSVQEALVYRRPWLRGSSRFKKRTRDFISKWYSFRSTSRTSAIIRILKWVFGVDPWREIRSIRKKIQRMRASVDTAWGNYHGEYLDHDGKVVLPERFQRIIQIIRTYRCSSVLELAGNAGVLSERLIESSYAADVICTDYDPCAIDQMFLRCEGKFGERLKGAVLDLMAPEYSTAEVLPQVRFKSDCVLALAVTHHLALTQGYSFEEIFNAINAYARRIVVIEFMPLGLWDGKTVPVLPGWYTQDDFEREFTRAFKVLLIEPLEENRVLFVGEVIG